MEEDMLHARTDLRGSEIEFSFFPATALGVREKLFKTKIHPA